MKKLLVFLMVVICLISTTGCGKNSEREGNLADDNDVSKQIENETQKITFLESDLEKIELDYAKLNLIPKKSNLYFNHIDNDILYLSVLDEINNPSNDLMTTTNLITYNLKNKEYQIYNYDYKIRIWDYIIKSDTIYFTTIESTNDGKIEWSLVYSDLNFNNQKILMQGRITDGLFSPNIILDNDNIYVITMTEDDYSTKYSFYKINSDNSINEVYRVDSSVETIAYLYKVYIKDENIYYISHDKTKLFLNRYDYKNNKKEIIFSTDDMSTIIFEFLVMDDYTVINLTNSNNDNSNLILKYSDGKIINVEDKLFLTNLKRVSDNKFLTHNNDIKNNTKIFKLFNSNGEVEKIFNFENLNIDYKYMVYDSNYIIISNYDPNELYIFDLKKLK